MEQQPVGNEKYFVVYVQGLWANSRALLYTSADMMRHQNKVC